MVGDLAYLVVRLVTTFLALDAAWHFAACKIKDKIIRPWKLKSQDVFRPLNQLYIIYLANRLDNFLTIISCQRIDSITIPVKSRGG